MISGYFESCGLRLAYHGSGRGDPIVFIHGAMADHRVWQDQIDLFSERNRVIAWDGPGAGESDDPTGAFDLDDYAVCLNDLLRLLEIDRAHLVGHSFGGGLAIQMCNLFPERVKSLVLVGAYAGWAGSLPAEEVRTRLAAVAATLDGDPAELVEVFMASLVGDDATADARERVRRGIRDFHPAGIRALAEAFARADLSDVLPAIDVPTTVIHGELDQRAPMRVAMQLVEAIPRAVLREISGVGHESYQENPAAFNAILTAHLDTAS